MIRSTRNYLRILGVAACALWLTVATPVVRAQKGSDAQILTNAQRQLKDKRFAGVHVQVQGGVVQLTGQVERYADKADAEKRIDKMHEAASVHNEISVAGAGNVSDAGLFQKWVSSSPTIARAIPLSVQQHHAASAKRCRHCRRSGCGSG